jgi:hypothetical protein
MVPGMFMESRRPAPVLTLLISIATTCATVYGHAEPGQVEKTDLRRSVISRAQVWSPTDVSSMDLKVGPEGPGAVAFHATVLCDYVDKKLGGNSPKFLCAIGKDDQVKVKFGRSNGEVFGEVLATRLLWALGFRADRMYPVDVICRGCPPGLSGHTGPAQASRFDPAVIERDMPGTEWPTHGKQGWSWKELEWVNADAGGAPRAQIDALKLLAVFIQHTDSKTEQQSIICLEDQSSGSSEQCNQPFLMISDLGMTFGRANRTNADHTGSVNLVEWRRTPVWKSTTGCTGNLPKSLTGTLEDPVIGEEGRRFLADRLVQLSERQIRDLFEVARVELRLRIPGDASSGLATIDEWVGAFNQKRAQIVERRCL